jgi:hypothetical protein
VQRAKIDLNSVDKSLIRGGNGNGNGNGWVGGIILNLVPSAIQSGCVNSPVFGVENKIGKLVFWRDVSYSPKLYFR